MWQEEPEQCMAVRESAKWWGNPKDMDCWSTVWESEVTRGWANKGGIGFNRMGLHALRIQHLALYCRGRMLSTQFLSLAARQIDVEVYEAVCFLDRLRHMHVTFPFLRM